jgi:hypothetical protein
VRVSTPFTVVPVCKLQVSAAYLNKSDRIWKSIATQYWRTKEERVRDMLQNGEDVSNVRTKFMSEVDPLDEDLNELPAAAPKMVFGDDLDDSRPDTAHVQLVPRFEDHTALWAATPQADHVKMMSISMKEVNATDPERRDSHSADGTEDHRRMSDASSASVRGGDLTRQLSHTTPAPALNPASRQLSSQSVSRQMSRQISRQMSVGGGGGGSLSRQGSRDVSPDHGHGGAALRPGGRGAQPKPDPFALVGRDEHPRFFDSRRPVPVLDSAAFAVSEESELLRLELQHLVHPHLPTLGEEPGPGKEGEGGMGLDDADDTVTAQSAKLESGIASELVSEKDPVPHRHSMQGYLDMLGLAPSTHASSSLNTNTRTSTFEQFDRIFDRLADTIVGALETAFQDSEEGSVAPSVVGSLQDHDAHHAHEVPIHTPGGEEGHHHERHIVPHEDGPGFLHGEAVVTASAKLAMQAVGIPVPDVVARIPTAVEESGDSTRPGSSKRSSRSNTRPSSGKGNKGAHVHGHIHGHIHAGKDSNKGSPSAARGTMHSKQRRRSFDGRAPSPHLSHDSSFGGTPSDKSMGSVGSLGSHGEKRHTVAFGSSVTTARRPSLDGLTDLRKASLEAVSPAALRAPLPSRSGDHVTPPKHAAAHTTQLSPIAVGAGASAHSPSPAAPPAAMSLSARPLSAKSPSRPTSVNKGGGAVAEGVAPAPQRSPSAGRRAGTQVAVRSPSVPTVTVTTSPAVRSGRKTVVPSSPTAAAASGSSAQVVFTDTINTSDVAAAEKVTAETATAVAPTVSIQPFSRPNSATTAPTPAPIVVPQEVMVRASADADDAVSAIEEASVEFTAVSTPVEQRRSNAPSRAKMVFSDDLLPSPREGEEDDVNSEMSPQQYADEHGRAVFYSADGRPILGHHDLSLSAAATPSAGSAIHSPRSAGSHNHPRRHRGETFDETASSVARAMMDNISHEMSTELEPPFEGYEAPERYLPEKGLRDAIFGGDIDMGAAGLVSFLQSFASSGKPSEGSKKRPQKEAEPVQEQGYVAVPIGGEWKLQPSGAGASVSTYSPKMRPLSPGGANKRATAGLSPQPNITLPSPQQPPPQSFLLEGTAVTTSHKPKEDFLKLKVPALSPTDHRYVRRSAELPLAQPYIATPQLSRNLLSLSRATSHNPV